MPPGPGRRFRLVEHGRLPVVERVPGFFLHVDDHVGPPGHRVLHGPDLLTRDVRVAAPEDEQQRRGDLVQHAQLLRHGRAVERDHRVQRRLRGDQVGDGPAEAEPDDPDAAVHLGQRGQHAQRMDGVRDPLRDVEPGPHLQRRGQARIVVGGLVTGLEAPEQVGRGDHVPEAGQVLGHGPDVVAHPVDLLDEQQAGPAAVVRNPHRQIEEAIRGPHRVHALLHGLSSRTLSLDRLPLPLRDADSDPAAVRQPILASPGEPAGSPHRQVRLPIHADLRHTEFLPFSPCLFHPGADLKVKREPAAPDPTWTRSRSPRRRRAAC